MVKCRITVLLQSAAKNAVCFNPLITVEESDTIEELQQKALDLYGKKAKSTIVLDDIIALSTHNAGVESMIVDESESVIDVLGRESTITILVKDAVDVLSLVAGVPHQLLTPISSAAPSLDHESAARRFRTAGNYIQSLMQQTPSSNKRKRSTDIGIRSHDHQAIRILKHRDVRRSLPGVFDRGSSSAINASNDLEDEFQFTRRENTSTRSTASSSDPVFKQLKRDNHNAIQATLANCALPVVNRSGSDEVQNMPLTRSNLDLIEGEKKDTHVQNGAISVQSSSVHSSHLLQPELGNRLQSTSNDRDNSNDQSSRDRTKAFPTREMSQVAVKRNDNESASQEQALSSSSRESDIAESNQQPDPSVAQVSSNLPMAETSSPCRAATADSSAESTTEFSESDLADFLSSTSEELDDIKTTSRVIEGTEPKTDPGLVSNVSAETNTSNAAIDDDDDSSSMKSGDQHLETSSASGSSDDEPEAVADKESQVDNKLESSSFRDLSRSSPADSHRDSLPDLESASQSVTDSGVLTQEARPSPIRPSLRSSYKSLSFLHDQSLRERDDLSRLSSPLKPTQLSQPIHDPVDTDTEDEGDDETGGSSASETSSDSEDDGNVPASKRAKMNSDRPKKRHSQGAKAFLRGLI